MRKENIIGKGVILSLVLVLCSSVVAAAFSIKETDPNVINFSVNGETQLLLDSLGNLNLSTGGQLVFGDGSIQSSSNPVNGSSIDILRLVANNTLFVNGSRVGIGTSAPSSTLNVIGGDILVDPFDRKIGYFATGSNNGYLIPYDSSGDTQLVNERTGGSLIFKTANTEKVRITSDGEVGIGDTSPEEHLTVVGNFSVRESEASARVAHFESTTGSFNNQDMFVIEGNSGTFTAGSLFRVGRQGDPIFYVQGDGNIGIGTVDPTLSGSISRGIVINASSSAGLQLRSDSANVNYEITVESDDAFALSRSGSELLRVVSDGSVGIGTTNPTKRLSVNGTLNSFTVDPNALDPTLNTTGVSNITITSSDGSVIIQLG